MSANEIYGPTLPNVPNLFEYLVKRMALSNEDLYFPFSRPIHPFMPLPLSFGADNRWWHLADDILDTQVWVVNVSGPDMPAQPLACEVPHNNKKVPGENFEAILVFSTREEAAITIEHSIEPPHTAVPEPASFGSILSTLLHSRKRYGLSCIADRHIANLDPKMLQFLTGITLLTKQVGDAQDFVVDEYVSDNLYPQEHKDLELVMAHMRKKELDVLDWRMRGATINGQFLNVLEALVSRGMTPEKQSMLSSRLLKALWPVNRQCAVDLHDTGYYVDRTAAGVQAEQRRPPELDVM